MSNNSIYLVITNMDAFISKENIDRINASEGTNYPSLENTITYQNLWDSRTKERGYKRHLNGVELWVLPYLKGRVEINPLSEDITKYSYAEYLEFEKTLDPIEIEGEPI